MLNSPVRMKPSVWRTFCNKNTYKYYKITRVLTIYTRVNKYQTHVHEHKTYINN
jgi:hypothetical protein